MSSLPAFTMIGFLVGDFEAAWDSLASNDGPTHRGNFMFAMQAMVLLELACRCARLIRLGIASRDSPPSFIAVNRGTSRFFQGTSRYPRHSCFQALVLHQNGSCSRQSSTSSGTGMSTSTNRCVPGSLTDRSSAFRLPAQNPVCFSRLRLQTDALSNICNRYQVPTCGCDFVRTSSFSTSGTASTA